MDEAAGDALFAMLVQHELTTSPYLHLIGFSRGSVVVSEATQRLDQLTILDGEPGRGLHDAAGPPVAWEGVGFVDNYYGKGSPGGSPCGGLFRLQGEQLPGAYNEHLKGEGHTGVRDWYTRTVVDTSSSTGFARRRDEHRRNNTTESPARARLNAPPTIVNGDFDYRDNARRDKFLAGWAGHGGGGGGERWYQDGGVLRLSAGGDESRTHNRLYIPPTATHLEFDMKRTGRDGGRRSNDRFDVLVSGQRLARYDMRQTESRYVQRSLALPDNVIGKVVTIEFRLTDIKGRRVNSHLRISDVEVIPAPGAPPRAECRTGPLRSDEVRLFSEPGLRGMCAVRDVGTYPSARELAPLANDTASSIELGVDAGAQLCEHDDFTGACVLFQERALDLAEVGLNDRGSSLRVFERCADGPRSHQVRIFEHINFRGWCAVLDIGDYPIPEAFAPLANDTASSIQVGADVSVGLCEHVDHDGHCITLDRNVSDLTTRGINDLTSSVQVMPRP